MNNNFESVLSSIEKVNFSLRSLFLSYGYEKYNMNKFEEYDLYAKNKEFLISDSVITFTDKTGKLMALKPDVTLSIIKNTKDDSLTCNKLFYNESVYRVSKGTGTFKEIVQTGLECLGNVTDLEIIEVLTLSIKSLENLSKDFALDIGDLDVVEAVIKDLAVDQKTEKKLYKLIAEKNSVEIKNLLQSVEKSEKSGLIIELVETFGDKNLVLPLLEKLRKVCDNAVIDRLIKVIDALYSLGFSKNISIDFSVIENVNYYNGLVFNGFIKGFYSKVLSGGQYDRLMKKMNKKSKAIGFAVYLDGVSRLNEKEKSQVDCCIVFSDKTEIDALKKQKEIIDSGKTCLLARKLPENVKVKKVITL